MDQAGIASTSESREGHQPSVPLARWPMREPRHEPTIGSRIHIEDADGRLVVLTQRSLEHWSIALVAAPLTVLPMVISQVAGTWSDAATVATTVVLVALAVPLTWRGVRRLRRGSDRREFVTFDAAARVLRLPQAGLNVSMADVVAWHVIDVPARPGSFGILPHAQLILIHRRDGRQRRHLVLVGTRDRGAMIRLGQRLSSHCGCGSQHGVAEIGGVDGRGVFVASGWDDPRLSWPVDQPEHEQFADAPPVDCVKCGYSRAGLSALQVCPECGQI